MTSDFERMWMEFVMTLLGCWPYIYIDGLRRMARIYVRVGSILAIIWMEYLAVMSSTCSVKHIKRCWNWTCGFDCRDWPQQGHPETPRWLNRVSEYMLYMCVDTFVFCINDVNVFLSRNVFREQWHYENFEIENIEFDGCLASVVIAFPIFPHHNAGLMFIFRLDFYECGVMSCLMHFFIITKSEQCTQSKFQHLCAEIVDIWGS